MAKKPPLAQKLTDKIDAQQQFLIQFSQYNGGEDTFFPVYNVQQTTIQKGDIIAWFWGKMLKFGYIKHVFNQSCIIAAVIPRESTYTEGKVAHLAREEIVCRFTPE